MSANMSKMNSVKIVEEFWATVWQARNPDAIDRFVVDDFVITTGGVDIVTKDRFKEWMKQFLEKVADLEFEVVETFQNEDGSRVASRWRVTGKNNGVLGMPALRSFLLVSAFLSISNAWAMVTPIAIKGDNVPGLAGAKFASVDGAKLNASGKAAFRYVAENRSVGGRSTIV